LSLDTLVHVSTQRLHMAKQAVRWLYISSGGPRQGIFSSDKETSTTMASSNSGPFRAHIARILQQKQPDLQQASIQKNADSYYAVSKLLVELFDGDQLQASLKYIRMPEYYTRIPEVLEKRYANVATRSSHITALLSITRELGKDNPRIKEAYEWLTNASKEIYEQRDKAQYTQEEDPESDEDNITIDYKELLKKAEEYVSDLAPVFNIKGLLSASDCAKILRGVAAQMNVIEPCCRSALWDLEVTYEQPEEVDGTYVNECGEPLVHNTAFLPMSGPGFLYVVNDKLTSLNKPADHWELRQDTTDLLIQSQYKWPRNKVFTFKDGADKTKYQRLIKNLFGATATSIRHSQVNRLFEIYPSPSMQQREYLARRMRHSTDTQERIYRKIIVNTYPSIVDLTAKPMWKWVTAEETQGVSSATSVSTTEKDEADEADEADELRAVGQQVLEQFAAQAVAGVEAAAEEPPKKKSKLTKLDAWSTLQNRRLRDANQMNEGIRQGVSDFIAKKFLLRKGDDGVWVAQPYERVQYVRNDGRVSWYGIPLNASDEVKGEYKRMYAGFPLA